jgi:Xaa-Pro aminopeptidase
MRAAGLDALVLTTAGHVRYATGAVPVHGDSSVDLAWPAVAVVTERDVTVLGLPPEAVPAGVAAGPLSPAPGRAAGALASRLGGARRLGVDRLAPALADALRRALPRATLAAADVAVWPARRVKTPAEIDCLRAVQQANEAAIADVLPGIVAGVAEVALTGRFLAAMAARGTTACHVEPLWCVLPRRAAEAPWSFADGPPYRELPGCRALAAGDQLMIDTGMLGNGYMSDFGCTWVVGGEPTAADRALRARWQAIVDAVLGVCRPGATAAVLHAAALAAADGLTAWPKPLYLAHGIGLGGVEPPFVGTDLGRAAEEAMVLDPGMVLVLEPYVWEEGRGGYRAETMIAITETGWEPLSAPPP